MSERDNTPIPNWHGKELPLRVGEAITLTPREAFGDAFREAWPTPSGDPAEFTVVEIDHAHQTITIRALTGDKEKD